MEETKVIEADTKHFEEEIKLKEAKIAESEKKYLTRLVKEAKDAGVELSEDKLLAIGENGIMAIIDMAKKQKTMPEKAVVQEKTLAKGSVVQTEDLYEPEWADGPICVQKNEMFRNWNYDYWRMN